MAIDHQSVCLSDAWP